MTDIEQTKATGDIFALLFYRLYVSVKIRKSCFHNVHTEVTDDGERCIGYPGKGLGLG